MILDRNILLNRKNRELHKEFNNNITPLEGLTSLSESIDYARKVIISDYLGNESTNILKTEEFKYARQTYYLTKAKYEHKINWLPKLPLPDLNPIRLLHLKVELDKIHRSEHLAEYCHTLSI